MSEPSEYIQYDTNLEYNKKIINPGDKITIYLRIKYKNSPDNYSSWGLFEETNKIDIKFNDYLLLSDNSQSKKNCYYSYCYPFNWNNYYFIVS